MISVGPINRLLVVGGGEVVRKLVTWSREQELPVSLILGERHAKEQVAEISFHDFLHMNDVQHKIVKSLEDKELQSLLPPEEGTLVLSVSAPWVFKPWQVRDLFNGQILNYHGSRLPKDRGGGGFSWKIMEGDPFGYCALHLVDSGIDTGDIVSGKEFLFPSTARTPKDYFQFEIEQSFQFLVSFLESVRHESRNIRPLPQQNHFSTYWPRLWTTKNGVIDWSLDLDQLDRFIRAFDDPYHGASTTLNGAVCHIKKVSLTTADGLFHDYQRGLVYRKGPQWICVAARGGSLIVEEVRDPEGRDLMDEIRVGDRFLSPQSMLEEGLLRARFSAEGPVG